VSESFLIGLDLGGGGLRCLLASPDSGRVVTASRPWAPRTLPGALMGFEYDADATWAAFGGLVREALARAGAGPDDVLGIAATSMRHGTVLLDAGGAELAVVPNRDARGGPAAVQLAVASGEEFHRRTGHWPSPIQPGMRLIWYAKEAPELLARTATHLSLSDWIGWRLCGERASEPSQACETLLLEIEHPAWAWDLVDRLGLPRHLLPELRESGSRLGELKEPAAAALGLRAGTPVAVGGGDSQCGLLGSGVVGGGQLGVAAGTSAPVLQVADRPLLDEQGRLWAVHHVVPGRWALESNAGGAGEALDWIAGLLYADAPQPAGRLLAEARQAPAGSAGLLSTLGVEVMDARRLSLPVGNLTLNYLTTLGDLQPRRHLARSILEGIAFSLRTNARQVEDTSGVIAPRLRVGGGLSRSPFFTQLLADAFDRPVEAVEVSESTALGAAICAGVGCGVFPDLEAGAEALVRIARRHEPDPEARATYQELYPEWNALREARVESDARASGVAYRALASAAPVPAAAAPDFRPRILVAADLDEEGLEALGSLGDVEYRSYREAMRLLTGPALVEALRGVQVFVTEVDVLDAASLVAAPDLRVVAVCRGDAVNVDLEACTALGIPVLHTPGRNADAVADLTLAFLLMLARKLPEAGAFLHQPGGEAGDMGRMGQAFKLFRGRELWRKTVGLVGLGAVGRKVVARLRPFGAGCLVYDPYLPDEEVHAAGAEPAPLDELLATSDFVSLHAAVTDQSRHLLNADRIARMKPGACLVNTARAALVDEEALLEALRSDRLGGAALDVFAVEPPASDHPLLQLPQVIATPHLGGNTLEVSAHQGRIVAEELERLRRGALPHHALNPDTLAEFRWSEPRPDPSPELVERLGRGSGPAVTDLQKEADADPPATRRTVSTPKPGGSPVPEVRESMERLLGDFVERVAGDARLREFAGKSQEVTLHFTLTDLGSEFHIGFGGGSVFAGLGPPASSASVRLKMRADLLDGMFTGRHNAMQAAMNGELSFHGDTAKAMTLSQIDADLSRLYQSAREAVGDLAGLPGPETGPAASPQPAARPGSAPAGDIRHELCEIVDELYAAQLITATGGNVSVRIPGRSDEAWITPSQLFKGDLAPEILVRVGIDGRPLDEDARSPSSEALMHAAVLKAKAEAQAVIHCHAPHATVLANAELPFLPISTEAAFFQNLGRIPFVMPGTQELADAVVEAMGEGWGVLMQNHGLLVAGRTLRRAADSAEIIERTAQVILGCYAVGREPPVLPPETVEMLSRYGDLMA
jgi:autoinducer 2 (AI-2) kinase